ncbi:hypothetical protein [Tamlana sp. I1]|uniref:hypothetical protein n=1 Tax=Tamlana sp. I1 TaxID=2762061 RepID=UPI0018908F04|nr:hypothetical protein [Tamlana sp. I1]
MTECKNCKTERIESEEFCDLCNYPIKGTEKEQAAFIAKQIMQKSDVLQSIERLKKSRNILFLLGAFNIIVPFLPIFKISTTFEYVFSISLGLILVGFGFLTFKKPKIALFIPLSLFIIYYVILFLINPIYLFSGMIWKMIIIMGLGYGYLSVKKSDKILKENTYLASVLGFVKIENQ